MKHAEEGQSGAQHLSRRWTDNSESFLKKTQISLLSVAISFYDNFSAAC